MAAVSQKVVVFISGGGSNLQALIDAGLPVVKVIANRECGGLARAQQAGIPTQIVPEPALADLPADTDLIVLAGYLRVVPPAITAKFSGRIINIHPSLLPRHGGKGMYGIHVHRAVLAAGEEESGCSVHFVTDGIDEGQIIEQRRVPVLPDDDASALAARVLVEEHKLIVSVTKKVLAQLATASPSHAVPQTTEPTPENPLAGGTN